MLENLVGKHIYLDANPIIYFLNNTLGFTSVSHALFQTIDKQQTTAYAGQLCLAELLVKPIKENKTKEIQHIHQLFDAGYIHLLAHSHDVFLLAAQIRAENGLKMLDAIHVATAICHGCDIFVTGDIKIAKAVKRIAILNLHDFIDKKL